MPISPLELDRIVISKISGEKILDVGAGWGKWGFLTKKHYCEIVRNYTDTPYVAGLDIFFPYLITLKNHKIYDLLVNSNGLNIPFKNSVFDTVIASEILEHLDKKEGYYFIDELKRITKKRLIITTPNYFYKQKGENTPEGYNAHEEHKCSWKTGELKSLGFKCYGSGLKHIRNPLLHTIFHSLSYKLPRLSRIIIGIFDK